MKVYNKGGKGDNSSKGDKKEKVTKVTKMKKVTKVAKVAQNILRFGVTVFFLNTTMIKNLRKF